MKNSNGNKNAPPLYQVSLWSILDRHFTGI
ncbi:hypothetical protein NMG60_11008149 [Bertholletia excelsa]